MSNCVAVTGLVVTGGSWTQVVIRALAAGVGGSTTQQTNYINVNFGLSGPASCSENAQNSVPTASTDVLRIGGFQGQLQDLIIYSQTAGDVTNGIILCFCVASLLISGMFLELCNSVWIF